MLWSGGAHRRGRDYGCSSSSSSELVCKPPLTIDYASLNPLIYISGL